MRVRSPLCWGAGLLSVLATACSNAPSFLAWDGSTLLLATEGPGPRALIVATPPTPITAESARVRALFYPESPSELGLLVGRLEEGAEGRTLPEPSSIWEATATDPDWHLLDALPADLAEVHLPVSDPCVLFESTSYSATGLGGALSFAVRAGPELALLSLGGALYTATRQRVEPLAANSLPTDFGYYDAPRAQIWLFGAGQAYRGTIDGGFQPAPSPPFVPVALEGSFGEAPEELFAASSLGAIWRYWEGAWSEVVPDTGPAADATRTTIAWVETDHAVLTGIARDQVVEYNVGTTRTMLIPEIQQDSLGDAVLLAHSVAGWGTMIGTRSGHLYTLDRGRWQLLSKPAATSKVYVIEALDRGLLFGGEDGVVNQLQPPSRLCEPQNYGSFQDQSVSALLQFGPDLLFLTPAPAGSDLRITVLRRR